MATAINVYAADPADPLHSTKPVYLDANEPLVVATSFLPWYTAPAPAGSTARVGMCNFQMNGI